MARGFNPARFPSGGAPNVISYVYTAAQAFKKGALVVDVGAGTISECGADPAKVLGVAAEECNKRPGGAGIANSPSVITGGAPGEVSVHVANRTTVFSCRGVSAAGGDPTTPAQTNIGESYGVAKDADGQWYLDLDEVGTKQCMIVDIDIDQKIFFIKFLEAVLSLP